MSDLLTSITSAVEKFKIFLLSYYLPGVFLIFFHLFIFLPVSVKNNSTIVILQSQQLPDRVDLYTLLQLIFLPVFVGMVLFAFNGSIIKLYEGKSLITKVILYPCYRFNKKRSLSLYKDLASCQKAYLKLLNDLKTEQNPDKRAGIKQLLESLADQIDGEYRKIEKINSTRILPLDDNRISSTKFGNTFAVIEEYAFQHYGIDTVLFWPYMNKVLIKDEPLLVNDISNRKANLDFNLNLSVISLLSFAEVLLFIRYGNGTNNNLLIFFCCILFLFFIFFYKSSINALEILGDTIKICYDFHREKLLTSFGFSKPKLLEDEQELWIRLALFIRRGDLFYFPDREQ